MPFVCQLVLYLTDLLRFCAGERLWIEHAPRIGSFKGHIFLTTAAHEELRYIAIQHGIQCGKWNHTIHTYCYTHIHTHIYIYIIIWNMPTACSDRDCLLHGSTWQVSSNGIPSWANQSRVKGLKTGYGCGRASRLQARATIIDLNQVLWCQISNAYCKVSCVMPACCQFLIFLAISGHWWSIGKHG